MNNSNMIANENSNQADDETNGKVEKEEEKEEEDDVWILGSMFDAVSNRASVGIFDGKDISKGMNLPLLMYPQTLDLKIFFIKKEITS